MSERYRDAVGKYLVVYTTPTGGTGVINVFKTKAQANRQVMIAKKSASFKKLGYKNPRVKLNR